MNRVFTILIVFSFSLFGEDNLYLEGEQLYFAKGCLNCHGTEAKGLHTYPSLANRSKWDLKRRLLKFRAGFEASQQSLLMIPFAKELSDRDIELLSYFLENIKEAKSINKYYAPQDNWGDGGS